jgi:hypothetical protein
LKIKARNQHEKELLDGAAKLVHSIENKLSDDHALQDELARIRRAARHDEMLRGPDGASYREFLEHLGILAKPRR